MMRTSQRSPPVRHRLGTGLSFTLVRREAIGAMGQSQIAATTRA
jgi:hypothetical protein